jgi:hypothetical protein
VEQPAAIDEDEALTGFAQDVELPLLVRMETQNDQSSIGMQAAEEVEHEADVAVLRVELRLVEQVHAGARSARARAGTPAACA